MNRHIVFLQFLRYLNNSMFFKTLSYSIGISIMWCVRVYYECYLLTSVFYTSFETPLSIRQSDSVRAGRQTK